MPLPLAATFPVHDWQFWAVTAIALLALAWLLRNILPVPFFSARAKRKKQRKKVGLTISARRADQPAESCKNCH